MVRKIVIRVETNQQEFEQVVRDYYDDVYRFAFSLTKAQADAVDLTQNAFLKFAKKGADLKDLKKAKSWLFTVTRNEFIDGERRKKRFPSVELAPENSPVVEADSESADWSVAIKALDQVDDPYREPLVLYYLQGFTYQEIADILEVPIGTVMSRLSRGKARLRDALEPPAGKEITAND